MSLDNRVSIPPNIAQFQSQELFYSYIYPPYLLTRAYYNLNTFHDCAILTVYNNTVIKINEAILTQLYGSLSTFYSIDSIEQNREEENYIKLLLAELLWIFNPSSLPPLKLSLKVGVPIILLQNLYPKEGLYNGTYIVITRIGRRYIKTQVLSGTLYNQLQLLPYVKLTSIEGELLFIITRQQFLIQLYFTITINKS